MRPASAMAAIKIRRITDFNMRSKLRELARQVAEIAAHPAQKERRELWRRHNSLRGGRPMVLVSPLCWKELISESVYVTADNSELRPIETYLRHLIFCWNSIPDDKVTEAVLPIPWVVKWTKDWGVAMERVDSGVPGGAYRWKAAIHDPSDFDKVTYPEFELDRPASVTMREQMEALFGDILPIRQAGCSWPNGDITNWIVTSLTQDICFLRGDEQVMMDLIDNPAFIHKALTFMADGYIKRIQLMEREGMLALNSCGDYVGSASLGYTDELPAQGFDAGHVRLKDIWGYVEAQGLPSLSPAMFEEFILPHAKRILELFGLGYYGCCEPLHDKVRLLKQIANLRKISISPWADAGKAADESGDDCILCVKPNPEILLGESFDLGRCRKTLASLLGATRGRTCEIVLKDIMTVHRQPWRLTQWTEMVMALIRNA